MHTLAAILIQIGLLLLGFIAMLILVIPVWYIGGWQRKQAFSKAADSMLTSLIMIVFVPVMLAAMFAPIAIYISHQPAGKPAKTICTTMPVPYDTRTQQSDAYDAGTQSVTQYGVQGEKKTCTLNGDITSINITSEPVTEIVTKGTHETHLCEVTLCNDGTCSYSQGRGTCSWHGGVEQYY